MKHVARLATGVAGALGAAALGVAGARVAHAPGHSDDSDAARSHREGQGRGASETGREECPAESCSGSNESDRH